MQAIILAGGKGTRLADRLSGKPKPLVDVCGIPLLERQIRTLQSHGVDDVIVLVNHAADQIRTFFASNIFTAKIRIVDDGEPRGTAGAVLACLDVMAPRTLIIYGDTLFDIDLIHMLAAHESAQADTTLLLHPNDHPADSDLVALDGEGYVRAFHAHPHAPNANLRNLVNAALYVVERDALVQWRNIDLPSDFAHNLFPAMIAAGQKLFGYLSAEYIKDLGTPSRLDKVQRHLASNIVARASRRVPQNAVFIDRDGTLNRPGGHISKPENITLIPGSAEALKRLNDNGLRTIIVTNQPVIARGECDFATLDQIHGRLEMLLSKAGGYVDRIYFCPHHPDGGYEGEIPNLKFACSCRKPEIGMIEDAIADLNINRHRSWMVGDSAADIEAASKAGLLSILVLTGEKNVIDVVGPRADMIAKDFAAASTFILEEYPALIDQVAAHAALVHDGDIVLVHDASSRTLAAVLRNELRGAGRQVTEIAEGENPSEYSDTITLILQGPFGAAPLDTKRRTYYLAQTDLPGKYSS